MSRAKQRAAFADWFLQEAIERGGIQHFTVFELMLENTRGDHRNELPPAELWPNILQTLQIVDALRSHIDYPITILSAYRDPVYNKLVGGARRSQHVKFTALDITSRDTPAMHLSNVLQHWRSEGVWTGGLGLYVSQNFVHIDTRGRNSTFGDLR